MATLFLICGMAGAGKTTYAKQMESEYSALRLSPDEWIDKIMEDASDETELERLRDPIESLQWATAQKVLSLGANVILENGFWSKQERMAFRAQAKALGVNVELHYLEVAKDELWHRIEKRNADLPAGSFPVTEQELESWLAAFEPPTSEELRAYDNYEIEQ